MQSGGIETEISETEIKILKDNSIPYKILVYDMAKFYEARNAAPLSSRPPSGICNSPDIKVPSHFHLGSMGGYFTLLEMENIFRQHGLIISFAGKSKTTYKHNTKF